jgi:hypothetical protein
MKIPPPMLRAGWIPSLLALLVTPELAAQTRAAPAAAVSEADRAGDIINLSPFVISESEDTGYAATSSMAGTRIKTNLEDIAASISVVTKDMMRDLGAHDSALLLNYTVGTEVSGIGGNFSGAPTSPGSLQEDSVNRELFSQTRVRGLSGADNTRDFFLTSVPWDGFNTDRIEISRGPNAMLFGTGSPAGIINMSTSKANALKNRTEVLFEVSNFGSTRYQFDNNTKIIDGVLAIRTAAKTSDQRFRQEEAYIRDKRAFVAALYKPFKHTSIRANHEAGRQAAAKPEWRPPFDNGILSWFEVGMPAVHPLTQATTLMGPVAPGIRYSGVNNEGRYQGSNLVGPGQRIQIISSMLGWGANNPTLVFDQPDKLGTSLYGLNGVWALTNNAAPVTGQRGSQLVSMAGSRNYMRAQTTGLPFSQFYGERQVVDANIFNFYQHMLDSNKKEDGKWRVQTISIEQLTPNGKGGVELSYHKESLNRGFVNPFNNTTYGLSVDINTHLLDGSTNPNFGRPMVASDSWSTETEERRESKRITGFYELEIKLGPEWLRRLIGKHTFTGSMSEAEYYRVTHGGRALAAGPEWAIQNPRIFYPRNHPTRLDNVINNASRGFQTAVYLGERANSSQDMNIRPITVDVLLNGINSVPVHYFHTQYAINANNSASVINNVGDWRAGGVNILRGSTFDKSEVDLEWTGGKSRSEVQSKVMVLHSRMFWGTVLPTLGYRKDTLKFYQAGTVLDPARFSISKAPLPSTPNSQFDQESFNWGTVVRLPASLEVKLPFGLRPSISYNQSDNFEPTQERINAFGAPIDPLKGETRDFGFLVSALGNKFSLRFTKYDTALVGKSIDMRGSWHRLTREGLGDVNNNVANGNNNGNVVARDAFLNWWNNDAFAATIKKTFEFNQAGRPSGTTDGRLIQTTDNQSRGNEFELTYNPTSHWRMALNYSEAEVINTNTARDFVEFLAKWKGVMDSPVGGVYRNNPGVNNDSGQTLREFSERTFTDVIRITAADGQPANPELRKKRVNFISNYSFRQGALKNFGMGGAVRWEDEVLIGTGYKVDSRLGEVPDYSTLYMGPSRTTFDAWISYRRPEIYKKVDLQVKLNVRNIGVGDKIVPTATQPDGTIRAWRISEPMTATLRTEFTF